MQEGFSTLWDGFASEAEAKAARDARYWELIKVGRRARRFALRNQLKPYSSLGVSDGRSCTVYFVESLDSVRNL